MKKTEEILIQCIDDIKAGRATLSMCLERYSDMRDELEPLLNIALSIKEKPDIKPSEAFIIRARANLMEYIHASQSPKKVAIPSSKPGISYSWFTGWARAVAITVAVVLIVATVGTGTAYASQSSLPGDTLYSVKLGTEQLQRAFTYDTASEVELEIKFAGIRLDELEKLAGMSADQAASKKIIQAERIEQAIAGYENNLNLAITKSKQMGENSALLEKVALAMLTHLDRIDEISDKASGATLQVLANSKAAALNGYLNVAQNLAASNPIRANEINLQAIQSLLERAEIEAAIGNGQSAEDTLQQMETLQSFGSQILDPAGSEGQNQGANNPQNTPGQQQGVPNITPIDGNLPTATPDGEGNSLTSPTTHPAGAGGSTPLPPTNPGSNGGDLPPPTDPGGSGANTPPPATNPGGSGGGIKPPAPEEPGSGNK